MTNDLNIEGALCIETQNSKEIIHAQVIEKLMADLKRAEERAEREGWIDAEDLENE